MEVIVKYQDYNEVIEEVCIPVNADQRMKLRPIEIGVGADAEKVVQIETVDDTISYTVTQVFTKTELRDYVQLLQKILNQIHK
jgi:hypothetical protein